MRAYQDLKVLAKSYRPAERQELSKLAARYSRRHEREVLELASIASDVSIDDITTLNLEPESNPLLREAFGLQYPNVRLDSLRGATEERLEGLANGVKGKYFEVIVCKKLNAGESVGDIQLESGQVAKLADSPNQPGWDLRIEDANGEVVQDLQLKATDSISYVKTALEKYPGIPVVVPNELDAEASIRDNVLASSISNEGLEDTTNQQLGELSEGPLMDLAGKSAEFGLDAIPIASAAVIAATETGMVILGKSSMKDAIQRGKGRVIRAGVYSTVGTVIMATPAGPIAIPTTMALRATEGRFRNLSAAGEHVEEKTKEILMDLERAKSGGGKPG